MPDMYLDVDVAITVPVNVLPLLDDTTFKDIEEAVAYNAAGMDLNWNFVTSAGVVTQTNVTPTTAGLHDWIHVGNGIYKIEIPASGGTINNDTEGYGWFSGVATGVLPWCGPRIGFRAAGLNDLLCDNAYSETRGLSGTALPAVAAEAAGGLYTRGSGAGQINQNANGQVDTNPVAISGDATAADNLESTLDGTGAVLTLTQLRINSSAAGGAVDIDNSNGPGVSVATSAGDNHGIVVAAFGNAQGIDLTGGATGHGMSIVGGANGNGLVCQGGTAIHANGESYGLRAQASAGRGMQASGTTYGFDVVASAGPAFSCVASGGNNSGIVATKAGTGYDIDADIHGTLDTVTTCTTTTTNTDMVGTDNASTHDAAAVVTALGTGTTFTAIPWNSSWDTEVQSECDDALVANHLDHLFKVDYDPASKPGTATALLNELVESDGGVSRYTENALEQAPDSDTTTGLTLHGDYDAAKTAAQAGDQMNLIDAPNATAITAIQSGLSTHDAAAVVTALGTGVTLTDCHTATSFAVAGDKMDLLDTILEDA